MGYYEDGVKRTLTDEQIRIFRHSEIHALLRERQRRREEEKEENEEEHGVDRESETGKVFDSQGKASHHDSSQLTATQKRKFTESSENTSANAVKKRTRHDVDGSPPSDRSPAGNNDGKAINMQHTTPSRDLNSGRRIVSYAED